MSTVTNKNSMKIRKMTALAMFCTLSYICVFVIKFHASFLTFDAKDAIMAIGGMFFGPVSAVVMSFVVSFIEFLTISETGVYGFIMNFAASAAFTVTASLIYKYRRRMSGAIIGLAAAVFSMTAVMLVMNLIITPYYMGASVQDVLNLIPTLLLPFNLIKAVFNASLVLLLYKPVTSAMKAVHLVEKHENAVPSNKKTTVLSAIIATAVFAVSLVIFFIVIGGNFTFFK